MESDPIEVRVTLQILEARIIEFINARIRNGEYTERGLAKILGISQPQLHNVLKRARTLRTDLADRILQRFELSVLDLLKSSELYETVVRRGTIIVGSKPEADDGPVVYASPKETRRLPAKMASRKAPSKVGGRLSKAG